jgi:hypothetical protein
MNLYMGTSNGSEDRTMTADESKRMVRLGDALAEFPRSVQRSGDQEQVNYSQVPNAFAIHGPVPPELAAAVAVMVGDASVALGRGSPDMMVPAGSRVSPVFTLRPGGMPAVPTGRVLVRFAEPDRALAHASALEGVGYRIAESVPHTPHAAWLESADGSIAQALARLPELESVTGIINVEPQMISPRSHRG